jgi:hypothetical protein
VHARLTKPALGCKISIALAGLLLATGAAAQSPAESSLTGLRECVAKARDPQAVAACERREQSALKERIEILNASIRKQLDASGRLVFERSVEAWQGFFDIERAMLQLTLSKRSDGLGATLSVGALNQLYEERERQLREHLHNLNQAGPQAVQPGR